MNVVSGVHKWLKGVTLKVMGLCLIGAASNSFWSNVNTTVYEWDETLNKIRVHVPD